MPNLKSKVFNYLFHKSGKYKKSFKGIWYFPFRVLYIFYSGQILNLDIKSDTQIGKGFQIFHGAHGSVVSPATVIGENVSLRQNTTIRAKGFNGSDKSPIIGNNVTIGPNVCIIGDIHIGDNSTIGAGAVVVKDVPANTIVAGNPARIICNKLNDNN